MRVCCSLDAMGKILLLNLRCGFQMFHIKFRKAILKVGLEVVYAQLSDVESGRTVGSFVSCLSALVTRERKQLCFPTSINIHRNRVSGGRSMFMIRTLLRSLKLNGVERGWTGRSWSNTQSLVGRSECFIGGLVLVNGPGCSVPVRWNHVRGTSRRHGCYSILNLSV